MPLSELEYYKQLIQELAHYDNETEWIEFKCNNKDPERIAKYISGISNSAALNHQSKGYLIWGIDNETHNLIGTSFSYRSARKGNEELEAWLVRMINPKISFRFVEVQFENNIKIVILEIPAAETEPVKFGADAYIRIGSNLKPLNSYPEKESKLWKTFDNVPFELRIAEENLLADEIIQRINYDSYYTNIGMPIPSNTGKILDDLKNEQFLVKTTTETYSITNLGALLLARDLNHFSKLKRKSVRVIRYDGNTRENGIDEVVFNKGYLESFKDIIAYILSVIPQNESISKGIRIKSFAFPETAIRELTANMMIHQDLSQRGTNPMVEIFSNRIEFSNPGYPLVAIERIIDTVPLSRNENLAGFMHRCGICEERGSGYDKIVNSTSHNQLLAPKIINQNNQFTKVILFSYIPFNLTSKEDRIWTCYMQACLAYVSFETINNEDIRNLFGLEKSSKVKASRIIKDTIEAGLIKAVDPLTAPRYMKYIPFWA